jgi:hypothetical protein
MDRAAGGGETARDWGEMRLLVGQPIGLGEWLIDLGFHRAPRA